MVTAFYIPWQQGMSCLRAYSHDQRGGISVGGIFVYSVQGITWSWEITVMLYLCSIHFNKFTTWKSCLIYVIL